jgi:hypothetical protein
MAYPPTGQRFANCPHPIPPNSGRGGRQRGSYQRDAIDRGACVDAWLGGSVVIRDGAAEGDAVSLRGSLISLANGVRWRVAASFQSQYYLINHSEPD